MMIVIGIRRASGFFGLFLLLTQLSGCAVGYYWQAGTGQMRITRGQQPVDKLLQEAELAPAERQRLEVSQEALNFAHDVMLLPDNGSYRSYFDTGERYVVWNVFAAPALSLEPLTWCFPVAGCIAYRGYFKEEKAQKYADKLALADNDVFVGGVTAYSTLGRLKDPLLNTMLAMPEQDFVGLLLHELAHQRLYIKDDSAFNEGFATAVEREGMRRWRLDHGGVDSSGQDFSHGQEQQVLDLLRKTRAQLTKVYAAYMDDAQKRAEKSRLLANLGDDYQRLVAAWQTEGLADRPYAGLFARGLNNASLSAVATYDDYVPAFELVLRNCDYGIECFYTRAEELGALDTDERQASMRELLQVAVSD
jgi:predicted aminopeptidase